ncbi:MULTISPECIES: type 1 glutamine amidotransferase domain-containing protein [unclassified Halomonas]|uniref:type 1 glutamine amidotransferase domain-containing protein n=1 Tax=unclassified Halomonas TaxID=2609666 RepID=UPI0005FA4BB8|nr:MULTISPECIES: type 1 glutamine amidotransferase domain-containing protein [unclassified Halomonas]KJZ16839.1 peptidase C56 [Halomonas sp. S2151]MCO7215942.1 type 1 glutamine amidotransferase domain-containing protein [Halomonas sp. OfavH-34-E]
MDNKFLVVVTSHAKYPNHDRATGLWLGEAVHFIDHVEQAGWTCDIASPKGGYTPIDPHSLAAAEPIDWDYYQNKDFMNRLGTTLALDEVNAADYRAIYLAGGHGVIWDFPGNETLQRLCRDTYKADGIVSSVCHGAVGLLNVTRDDGEYLIKGMKVTGFSNHEEHLAKLDDIVPFLTETELVERGGLYLKADRAWEPFAVVDERLVTGQNPASGRRVAELVLEALGD